MVEDRIYTADGYETIEIPDMDQIRKILESEGFLVQNVHESIGRGMDFSIIGENKLEDITGFAKRVDAKIIFIDECYLDKDSYIMDIELEEDISFLQKDLDEFNESLDSIDFDMPYDVFVYLVYEGIPFGIRFQNTVLVELASMPSRDRFRKFQERHKDDVKKVIKERNRKICEMEDSLLETIASNPDFQICTNQAARVEFMKRFLDRSENAEAKELLSKGCGFVPSSTLKGFGDRAWAIVKTRKQ